MTRKLTESQALEIRAAYLAGATEAELAEQYWLKPAIIKKIATATHWKQIQPYLTSHTTPKHKPRKLYPIEVKSIRALYERGQYTQRQLADKFHTSQSTVHRIVNSTATKM